jgi:hypothetical protein
MLCSENSIQLADHMTRAMQPMLWLGQLCVLGSLVSTKVRKLCLVLKFSRDAA